MAYTVKNLSKLSGVTVRTLHFYEQIGLLKPAYYGSNGYRYYEEKQLLQLQQILFFKELGLSLKQIQKIVGKSDFDQLAALSSHRQALSFEWEKIGTLLKTIDKTIEHLKGKKTMKDREIFDGFNITLIQAKEGQPYSMAEKIVAQSVKIPTKNDEDVKRRGKTYYDSLKKTAERIFKKLAACIEENCLPEDGKVQAIIAMHHDLTEQSHFATKNVYQAMAELYAEHPDFQKQLNAFHLRLAHFMSEAMKIFSQKLS